MVKKVLKVPEVCSLKPTNGLWLWHSWQCGRFRYQRTRFRIQSSATFIEQLFTVNCL